jgi:hypothetical protein
MAKDNTNPKLMAALQLESCLSEMTILPQLALPGSTAPSYFRVIPQLSRKTAWIGSFA